MVQKNLYCTFLLRDYALFLCKQLAEVLVLVDLNGSVAEYCLSYYVRKVFADLLGHIKNNGRM